MKPVLYLGLDVHKETIAVAGVAAGRSRDFKIQTTVPVRDESIRRFFGGLRRKYRVSACYEAGCMGYWLQRTLAGMGMECSIAAPTMLPRRPGDKVKTDNRDARDIALALRAGQVTGIFVPNPETEALRDLLRTREDLRLDLMRHEHRLSKFRLRHNRIYGEGKQWTQKHDRWLRGLDMGHPALQETLAIYGCRVRETEEHLRELDRRPEAVAKSEPFVELAGFIRSAMIHAA